MLNKILEKISGNWIFGIITIIIYFTFYLINPAMAIKSLDTLWNLIKEIAPDLLLVFVFLFLANLFLSPEKINHLVGKKSGITGWLIAILGGILSMGPIYMWYPLLAEFKAKGTRNALIAAFLYNRSIKLPLAPMMIYFFGWAYFIILSIYMIIFSIINGWLVEKFTGNEAK